MTHICDMNANFDLILSRKINPSQRRMEPQKSPYRLSLGNANQSIFTSNMLKGKKYTKRRSHFFKARLVDGEWDSHTSTILLKNHPANKQDNFSTLFSWLTNKQFFVFVFTAEIYYGTVAFEVSHVKLTGFLSGFCGDPLFFVEKSRGFKADSKLTSL